MKFTEGKKKTYIRCSAYHTSLSSNIWFDDTNFLSSWATQSKYTSFFFLSINWNIGGIKSTLFLIISSVKVECHQQLATRYNPPTLIPSFFSIPFILFCLCIPLGPLNILGFINSLYSDFRIWHPLTRMHTWWRQESLSWFTEPCCKFRNVPDI